MNDNMNNDSEEFNEDENLTKKKVLRTLGKRVYKKPINKKEKTNTQKDYNTEKTTNYSKLVRERFLYIPFHPLPDLSELVGEIIEIRISSEYLSKENKAFKERRVWGSDIYTSDSDPVCILQHSGYFKIKELSPTNIDGVSLYIRVAKGRSTYNSSFKNGIKSKKLNNYQGHALKPENYGLLKSLGSKSELIEMAKKIATKSEYERKKLIPKKLNDNQFFRVANLMFNLSNEMWMEYSIPAIADKGSDIRDFTSWKLKDKVLFIETDDKRFEIARNITDHTNDDYLFEEYETFKISEVVDPFQKDNDFLSINVLPLEETYTEEIFTRCDWHEIHWGENSVLIRDLEIKPVKCFNFYNIKQSKY